MGEVKDAKWYDDSYQAHINKGLTYSLKPEDTMYSESWNTVLKWLDDTSQVVELGCGVGQLAELIHRNGFEYLFGIDFSPVAIEQARKIKGMDPECFEVFDLYDPAAYDLVIKGSTVICLETLEHLEKDLDVIKQIPVGNRFIFSVPNYDYRSHVRFYKDKEYIWDRYQYLLEPVTVARIKMSSKGKCIWLCDSVRI